MSNEFHIDRISDTLQFDEAQFSRFIVDFVAWHGIARAAQEEGAEDCRMIWVDDGRMAVVDFVDLEIKDTGEKIHIDLRAGLD